ncbi:MAG: hypothetical protein HC875_13105 [Anaerolineales bacterium]|nr:hypothetical protein [Anaerolineales bacterium]
MTNTDTQTTDLPKGWVWTTIDNIAWVTKLAGFEFTKYIKYQESGPVKVIRGLNVGYGEFRDENFKYIDIETSDGLPRSQLRGGEILIAYVGTIGTVAILPRSNQRYHLGPNVGKIVLDELVSNPQFVMYYLLSSSGQKQIHSKSKAVTQSSLSMGTIRQFTLPLPPLAEQHRIVAKIEELFSDLDHSIAALETAQAQLKIYRQAVLKYAFEGKLTEQWRQQHTPPPAAELLAQIQAERAQNGKPAKSLPPLTESELAELPGLPEGWVWTKLSAISDVLGGLTKNSKRETLNLKVPYLRVANVYANKLDLKEVHEIGINESELNRVSLCKNDLLIVEGNGSIDQIGRVAIWNDEIKGCAHQNHIIKARPLLNFSSKFILYFLLSWTGRNFIVSVASSTSGLHTLSLSKVENLKIPICSLEEQQAIIAEIEARLSVIDKLEETIETSLQQAEALRQSILKQAFAGKLLPQDAHDEPATLLLERIKNAKGAKDARGANV